MVYESQSRETDCALEPWEGSWLEAAVFLGQRDCWCKTFKCPSSQLQTNLTHTLFPLEMRAGGMSPLALWPWKGRLHTQTQTHSEWHGACAGKTRADLSYQGSEKMVHILLLSGMCTHTRTCTHRHVHAHTQTLSPAHTTFFLCLQTQTGRDSNWSYNKATRHPPGCRICRTATSMVSEDTGTQLTKPNFLQYLEILRQIQWTKEQRRAASLHSCP